MLVKPERCVQAAKRFAQKAPDLGPFHSNDNRLESPSLRQRRITHLVTKFQFQFPLY